MSDRVDYWIEIAEYDLETARAMLQTGRFLYVGFMCHQVIEKMLKARYADVHHELPPKIHNLRKLAGLTDIYGKMSEEQKDFADALEPLNIESRYPEYTQKVYASLNADVCKSLLAKTENLHRWIKEQLSST